MNDEPEMLNPATLAAPVGLYSHLAITSHARLAFIAGQLSVDPSGVSVGEGDIDAQVERCFANVGLALDALGATWQHLLKMTTYLTSEELIGDFYRVRERLFADIFPDGDYPANTLLVVRRLVRPEFMIEIEGVAAI